MSALHPGKKPAGKPQGRESNKSISERLENKSDYLAIAMEEGIEYLAANLGEVLETVVKKAKAGNVSCARLILDRVLPPARTQQSLDGVVNVQINIGETNGQASKPIDGQAYADPYEGQASAGRASGISISEAFERENARKSTETIEH